MVNIIKRTRKLQELLWIRCGPGALILPKEVSKISMEFNTKPTGGHRGAKAFWREMLPRIKYRNPSVPISIARHNDPDGPSLLHIYLRSATSTSPSTTPSDSDSAPPTHTLNIRDQQDSQILDALVKTVGATPIETTAQEKQEIADMKELRERGERDRVEVREKLIKERREQEMLKLARGEVPVAA